MRLKTVGILIKMADSDEIERQNRRNELPWLDTPHSGFLPAFEHFWTNSYGSLAKNAWAGLSFEQVCKDHIRQIKQKIGISGGLSKESSWHFKGDADTQGARIDLMIDRRDQVID